MVVPGRALVVGLGRMGSFHAKVLRDLGYDVTTVDPDPARGAHWSKIDPIVEFDVAAVATPPDRLECAARAVAGTPRVLVEKPFAIDALHARSLGEYLLEEGSEVCVGFVERFNPQVRALRSYLARNDESQPVGRIRFTRWNDRPSFDADLDLKLHDVDLALWLGLSAVAEFDARADSPERVRRIEVERARGSVGFDLMDHGISPLHALWHAFLSGGDYPTSEDAIHALRFLDLLRTQEVAA